MCRIFAEEKLLQRVESGEFQLEVSRSNAINPPFIDYKGQRCVRTEELLIIDQKFPPDHHRHEVVRAHQFKLEDGKIGASGKPDPKEMMIGEINYRGLKAKNPSCELCETGDMIPPEARFRDSRYRPGASEKASLGMVQ